MLEYDVTSTDLRLIQEVFSLRSVGRPERYGEFVIQEPFVNGSATTSLPKFVEFFSRFVGPGRGIVIPKVCIPVLLREVEQFKILAAKRSIEARDLHRGVQLYRAVQGTERAREQLAGAAGLIALEIQLALFEQGCAEIALKRRVGRIRLEGGLELRNSGVIVVLDEVQAA